MSNKYFQDLVSVDISEKKCLHCKEWFPATSEFFANSASTVLATLGKEGSYLKSVCKKCQNKQNRLRERIKKIYPHPEDSSYKCPILNITLSQYKTSTEYKNSYRKKWSLDHSHDTDDPILSFRGYVSDNANNLLSRARDSKMVLLRAIWYLLKHDMRVIYVRIKRLSKFY